MTTDIFIVSYRKDFPWLRNCLKSVGERCRGFRRVNVVVPMKDLDEISRWGLTQEIVIGIHEPPISGDSIQQCLKLNAHTYTDADYIVYVDSDVYFVKEFTPEYMFRSGKPFIYMTEHAKIKTHWKPGMDHIMKSDVKYEYMRRFPLGARRSTLVGVGDFFINEHGHSVWDYYSKNLSPSQLSEFNIIGAYAHKFQADEYEFIDTEVEQPPSPVAEQFWSHGGASHPDNKDRIKKYGITL